MHCPKCGQKFEEGSRRFCPTDGSRLSSDTVSSTAREGGIFANLMPKLEGISDLDDSNRPTERLSPIAADADMDDVFFELDDIKPELEEPLFLDSAAQTVEIPSMRDAKPLGRKVNPYEIPAGHVDLEDTARLQGVIADFDENNPDDFVGQTVKGRYKVSDFLGGDDTGLAYLADDKIVEDRKVLVRVLLDGEMDEMMESILAEERVSLSHLTHPNIARLNDSGQFTGGRYFLVSEYVDALSVADIMGIHGAFNDMRAARIIRQAASALNEAHQEGILHRDIRPENLIVDTSGGDTEHVTVVNFGASNGDPTPRNISYKAPEILDGRIATVASDIFSLAVVAFEMVTGSKPFSGASEKEISRSQNTGMDALPSSVNPEISPAVDGVFEKAFSLNAAERYPKARDLGDAFYSAIVDSPAVTPVTSVMPQPVAEKRVFENLKPAAPVPTSAPTPKKAATTPIPVTDQPAWKNRSPEPPQDEVTSSRTILWVGLFALLALIAAGWYYVVNNPAQSDVPLSADQTSGQAGEVPTLSPAALNTEMPPQPRNLPQPPNTNFYQNSKQNLKGDLLRNFVGFTMYYPKEWKASAPQPGEGTRGQFVEISSSTPDDLIKEQMLVSYYPSKGTYREDSEKFPQLVKETNETLKKLLRDYQMVSEGEIKLNGDWRAYEIKFQGAVSSGSGEKLLVWGRRLFIPAARPGVRNGFEITMLATSAAQDVRSVDDVGVRGELASILNSFEPSQNF